MNTFWGCDPETLIALSETFTARAARLRHLTAALLRAVHATTWIGPDAQQWRERLEETVQQVIDLVEALRELAERLREDAEEQRACSQAESGAGPGLIPPGLRPWLPRLSGTPEEGTLAPFIWGPMVGGPFRPQAPWPEPSARELPDGEDFALDPGILARARERRELALGALPVVGTVQTLSEMHEELGGAFDRAEEMLEDNGLGGLAPAVSIARLPHAVGGAVLGENSVFGQVVSGIDQGIANTVQTGQEVSAALGEGDPAAAARAAERGVYRSAGATIDVLTATAVPGAAEAASEVLGTGADLVGAVDPGAGAALHEAERSVGDLGRSWEHTRDSLTDPERYYDLRRQHIPLPWDPQA